MLWLGALMALAACGGGESLTYDESMDLLSNAMRRTVAGAYSLDDTGIDVVEMDNSTGEYTFYIFSVYFDPERGWFGYMEDRNPFAPPVRRHFLTADGADYEFIEARQCYSDNPTVTAQVGPIGLDQNPLLMLPPVVMMPDKYIGGKRVIQDGSTTETIEFETGTGSTDSFTIQDGLLVDAVHYVQYDGYGRRVGDGFDGKIVAKKYIRRYYDIGVKKDFPVPEPICE